MATAQKSFSQYESLSTDAPKSIAWASTGGDGSGKSHFALTAPEPIFVCAFDPFGMNRVSKDVKLRADGKTPKEIRIARYPFNASAYKDRGAVQSAAMELWKQFRADYDEALTHCRTILWDREDLMYEMQRFANFGAQSDAPKEYGPLYLEYGWLIQKSQAHGVNLGVLRGIREKWVSKFDPAKGKMVAHNTGDMIPDGMKKIADHVDVTLDHRWSAVDKSFIVKIDKFTNPSEKDMEYPNLTFPDVAQLAYPETSAEEWM